MQAACMRLCLFIGAITFSVSLCAISVEKKNNTDQKKSAINSANYVPYGGSANTSTGEYVRKGTSVNSQSSSVGDYQRRRVGDVNVEANASNRGVVEYTISRDEPENTIKEDVILDYVRKRVDENVENLDYYSVSLDESQFKQEPVEELKRKEVKTLPQSIFYQAKEKK